MASTEFYEWVLVSTIARNRPRCYDSVMILIRFDDPQMEKRALGYLLGRFSGKTWSTGETLVPEAALAHLAAEGITFTVAGRLPYERAYAPVRDPAAAPL